MRPYVFYILILFLLPSIVGCQPEEKESIRVFYLGGQSNMNGLGLNSQLPSTLNTEFENVWIFQGNSVPDENKNGGLGKWEKLRPGHGFGFVSDGNTNKLSNRFGPELSFAKKMQELYPNEKIAILKYARFGSSIDSVAARHFGAWEPNYKGGNGINQYDNYLKTVKTALNTKDIDGDGKEDVLIPQGIIWMQGESDADVSEPIANRYIVNLKKLMNLMRVSLNTDDLPIVIGKISDSKDDVDGKIWDYGTIVQQAQEQFVKEDKNAVIIRDTESYNYLDPRHYDSNGYIDLGEKFAEAIYQLTKK